MCVCENKERIIDKLDDWNQFQFKRAKKYCFSKKLPFKCMIITMKCLSKSFKSFRNISCCFMLLIFVNNFNYSTSSLSTTIPTTLSTNYTSHEPTCANVKDLLIQRGITEKDIPKSPIKGECRCYSNINFLHLILLLPHLSFNRHFYRKNSSPFLLIKDDRQ